MIITPSALRALTACGRVIDIRGKYVQFCRQSRVHLGYTVVVKGEVNPLFVCLYLCIFLVSASMLLSRFFV